MISVIIPSIPPRAELLSRAISSATAQTEAPSAIIVASDIEKQGAPATRDRALSMVQTKFVAPLDDDDEMLPHHLTVLLEEIERTGADLVFPWFNVVGGSDPFPQWENVPWENGQSRQVPITWLARTDSVRHVGGFSYQWDPSQGTDPGTDADGNRAGEDFRLIQRMVSAGLKIVHLPQRTWLWHHDSGNTMGLPSRW